MGKLFGTDGIRGEANVQLTPELAFKIGRIGCHLLKKQSSYSSFLIARDTRLSGEMLEGALAAGIASTGADVRLLGAAPTPAAAYLARHLKAAGSVVISASHNPYPDNGIKFFNTFGFKLPEEQEDEIEALYYSGTDYIERPAGPGIGRISSTPNDLTHYLEYLKTLAPSLNGLPLVLDCAHGACSYLAPAIFRALGARLTVIHNTPDGTNINYKCGSTCIGILKEKVLRQKAALGLAFDGDGDRLIAVDEKGREVDGDAIMTICARKLIEQKKLANSTVVATVLSNGGLELAGSRLGFQVKRTRVGDRNVLQAMEKGNFTLGGEQSGHIIFRDHQTTGDGLLTALMLLEALSGSGQNLSEQADLMPRLPQVQYNCRVTHIKDWEQNARIRQAMRRVEDRLNGSGRLLVRASGTEPLIRIMLEGRDTDYLEEIASELGGVITGELN